MTQKVVSANYLNRRDRGQRWLIRGVSEGIDRVVRATMIEATRVRFIFSSQDEEGFGCSVVAYCETAEAVNLARVPSGAVPLRFDGVFSFINRQTGATVQGCDALFLTADGKMWAVNPTPGDTVAFFRLEEEETAAAAAPAAKDTQQRVNA